MTKQLRIRIMIILFLLLSATFTAIIVAINLGLNRGNRNYANDSLQFLLQRESRPSDIQEPSPGDNNPMDTRDKESLNTSDSDSRTTLDNQSESLTKNTDDNDKAENLTQNDDGINQTESLTENDNDTDQTENLTENDNDNDIADGSTAKSNFEPDGTQKNHEITSPPAKPENDIYPTPGRHNEIATSHYILAKLDKSKEIQSIDNTLSDSYSDEDITNYCNQILSSGKREGAIDQLRYMVRENKDNILIAFIDHSSAVESGKNLRIISFISAIIAIAFFALLSYILSGWMVKPVEDAFTKQKQFISDASHELKTPITVILSNSELLEDQIGENRQLSYIKKECDQMHYLVTSLLTLTRLEQTPYKDVEKNDFCISDTILERILPLESVAFEKGITMNYDTVTPELHLYGVKEQIGQVAAILIDNAITHTDKGGTITIALWKTSNHMNLTVANTGKEIPVEERERLFERFYRADESRHRASGHFGLGLSIAKTIVTNHKGKISVDCAEGTTTFTVRLHI